MDLFVGGSLYLVDLFVDGISFCCFCWGDALGVFCCCCFLLDWNLLGWIRLGLFSGVELFVWICSDGSVWVDLGGWI